MIEIINKRYMFRTKTVWFSDYPFDVENYSHVAFHACKKDIDLKGFTKQEFTTLVIDLTQDLDQIWKEMSKSSCRYAINRAEKDGINIILNENYKEFYEINNQFRINKGIGSYPIDTKFMRKYCTLFTAEHNGEIIGGQLYLEDKNNIRWLIGASRRLEVNEEKATLIGNGNRLMIWKAIKYAKGKGIKEFDFGGYYTGKEQDMQKLNINKFKESFGGKLVTHYIYQKDYSRAFKLAKNMCQYIKLSEK